MTKISLHLIRFMGAAEFPLLFQQCRDFGITERYQQLIYHGMVLGFFQPAIPQHDKIVFWENLKISYCIGSHL